MKKLLLTMICYLSIGIANANIKVENGSRVTYFQVVTSHEIFDISPQETVVLSQIEAGDNILLKPISGLYKYKINLRYGVDKDVYLFIENGYGQLTSVSLKSSTDVDHPLRVNDTHIALYDNYLNTFWFYTGNDTGQSNFVTQITPSPFE